MSVNFLHTAAIMVGVDLHSYYLAAPPDKEIPVWPYAVGAPFSWFALWPKRTNKATSEAQPMIRDGFGLILVPHIPLPAPPGPSQALEYLSIVGTSGSEPLLTIGSVTGEGDPLAVCAAGSDGLNLNCGPFESDQVTGMVTCVNSVQTTPTLADVVGAIGKIIAGSILAPLLGFLAGGALAKIFQGRKFFQRIPRWLVEVIVRQIVKFIFGKVTSVGQSAVQAMGI